MTWRNKNTLTICLRRASKSWAIRRIGHRILQRKRVCPRSTFFSQFYSIRKASHRNLRNLLHIYYQSTRIIDDTTMHSRFHYGWTGLASTCSCISCYDGGLLNIYKGMGSPRFTVSSFSAVYDFLMNSQKMTMLRTVRKTQLPTTIPTMEPMLNADFYVFE